MTNSVTDVWVACERCRQMFPPAQLYTCGPGGRWRYCGRCVDEATKEPLCAVCNRAFSDHVSVISHDFTHRKTEAPISKKYYVFELFESEEEASLRGTAIAVYLADDRPSEPAGNPLPPEILADALQDKIHEDTGAVRAGRSVKSNAHICADCGADLSKHPTSAAGHQCPRI